MYELCNQNIECGRPDEETNFVISKVTFKEKIFSADRLGLKEDFCIPLTAALVELAALDMRTTPLDRLVNKKLH